MKLNYFKIFKKLMPKAKKIYKDKERFKNLLDESFKKIDKKDLFNSISHELKLVFSLSYDFLRGRYRNVGKLNIFLIIVSLLYLINPIDIIPDFIIGFGLVDDLSVLTYLIGKIKKELNKYENWKDGNA